MRTKTNFISLDQMRARFKGKSIAVIGSGPTALLNSGEHIDSHDLIIRIQNYKMRGFESQVGSRTDVHYSFYGMSMRKTANELKEDGVSLCMCKLPDGALPFSSPWHRQNNKQHGVNYRYVYTARAAFWFCDTYVPSLSRFMELFALVQNEDDKYPGHQPTTGFACLLELMQCETKSVYVTGFDFFTSNKHNLNESWAPKSPDDPIGHRPLKELKLLKKIFPANWKADRSLEELMKSC